MLRVAEFIRREGCREDDCQVTGKSEVRLMPKFTGVVKPNENRGRDYDSWGDWALENNSQSSEKKHPCESRFQARGTRRMPRFNTTRRVASSDLLLLEWRTFGRLQP